MGIAAPDRQYADKINIYKVSIILTLEDVEYATLEWVDWFKCSSSSSHYAITDI
jgi:hypothetical protein